MRVYFLIDLFLVLLLHFVVGGGDEVVFFGPGWGRVYMMLSLSWRRLMVKDCSKISLFCCSMSSWSLRVDAVTVSCSNFFCLCPWPWTL